MLHFQDLSALQLPFPGAEHEEVCIWLACCVSPWRMDMRTKHS